MSSVDQCWNVHKPKEAPINSPRKAQHMHAKARRISALNDRVRTANASKSRRRKLVGPQPDFRPSGDWSPQPILAEVTLNQILVATNVVDGQLGSVAGFGAAAKFNQRADPTRVGWALP